MPPARKPAAEVDIDTRLVHDLLVDQHPDLAARPLELVAEGWDNALYRLGDDLTVRLPRRQAGAALVEHEHRWLGELAPRLPLPIPAPVRAGVPSERYPWCWSICPWFEGRQAVAVEAADAAGRILGGFVAALHQPAPDDAPTNPSRGGPLSSRDAITRERIVSLDDTIDAGWALAEWDRSLSAPGFSGEPVWLHGDLHPGNLVTDAEGLPVAVVDFGDLTSGDPACDLAVAWMWFDESPRSGFFEAAGGPEEATIARSRGWALTLGIACLANSADAPDMARVGRTTLARLGAS